MRTSIATVLALSLLSVVASAARGQTLPDPSQVYIESLAVSGTGSPAGTVARSIWSDAKAMTVLYDSFSVQTGDLKDPAAKTSTMMVGMHMPVGWSFTRFYIDTRGFADIAGDVTGTMTTQAAMKTAEGGWDESYPISTAILNGPYAGDYYQRTCYQIAQWFPDASSTSIFRIDTTIELRGGQSYITVDSIDGCLVSVPEPGSLAMLTGIALTALLYWWRKHV